MKPFTLGYTDPPFGRGDPREGQRQHRRLVVSRPETDVRIAVDGHTIKLFPQQARQLAEWLQEASWPDGCAPSRGER